MAPKTTAPKRGGSALDRLPTAGKVGLGAVLAFLGLAAYYVGFYGEIESQIASAEAQESTLRENLENTKKEREQYDKELDEKAQREARAAEQKKVLPDDAETPAFLSAVQNAATVSGVTLTSWSPIQEVPQEFYSKVPMKLTLTGGFHEVAKFFHTISQVERVINVEDIQIKKIDKKAGPNEPQPDPKVEVECMATAFRALPEGATAGRRRGKP